ncbi:MAG: phosphoribosyltransferase family protein [Dehalococcoidales bacterium]|nr:phosphoribosyltransferase family protein [Dehalococcoidales bacterium]
MEESGEFYLFKDRADAGKKLAERLAEYKGRNVVVLAVPRGGIPVAIEIASFLNCPLDILIVRKIPVPQEPEAGYGAVTEDGTIILNEPMVRYLGLRRENINMQAEEVRREILRRSSLYRKVLPPAQIAGRTAILTDDGLASGYTMLAAVRSLKNKQASGVVVAVPVASGSAFELIKPEVDDLVCPEVAWTSWFAVANYYQNWYDLSDNDVIAYLEKWQKQSAP